MTTRYALYMSALKVLNVHRKFEMHIAIAIHELIAIGVLVGVVNPNLGEEEVLGGH